MKIILEINCDNDAFGNSVNDVCEELDSIINSSRYAIPGMIATVQNMTAYKDSYKHNIFDSNGCVVGYIQLTNSRHLERT
jgi:hypothetical protein